MSHRNLTVYFLALVSLIAWSAAAARLVRAEDRSHQLGTLVVPQGCNIKLQDMAPIHLVLCDGDVACTARVVAAVCKAGAK